MAIFVYLLASFPPVYLGRLTDEIIRTGRLNTVVALMIVLISVLAFLAETVLSFLVSSLSKKLIEDKYIQSVEIILRKERKFFESMKIGEIIDIFSRYINGFEGVVVQLVSSFLPSLLASVVLVSVVAFIGNIQIVGWLILVQLVLFVPKFIYLKRYSRYNQEYTKSAYNLSDIWVEILGANKIIQSHHSFSYAIKRLYGRVKVMTQSLEVQNRSSSLIKNFVSFGQFFSILIIIIVLLTHLKNQNITVGDMLAVLTLSGMVNLHISNLINFALSLRDFITYHTDFERIILARSYVAESGIMIEEGINKVVLLPHVVKKNGEAILDIKQQIEINRGERICVIGLSGAGKTTFVSHFFASELHLQKFIMINGIRGDELSLKAWQNIVAMSFQENDILSGGHRDWLQQELSEEDAHLARKLMDELCLPTDLVDQKRLIDPYGTNISGGEQKRLNVGRTLFHIAEVNIFDEPTTGLNAALSKKVWDMIFAKTKNRILICTSHDISYVENFDRVIVIDDGKIVLDTPPSRLSEYKIYEKIMGECV